MALICLWTPKMSVIMRFQCTTPTTTTIQIEIWNPTRTCRYRSSVQCADVDDELWILDNVEMGSHCFENAPTAETIIIIEELTRNTSTEIRILLKVSIKFNLRHTYLKKLHLTPMGVKMTPILNFCVCSILRMLSWWIFFFYNVFWVRESIQTSHKCVTFTNDLETQGHVMLYVTFTNFGCACAKTMDLFCF